MNLYIAALANFPMFGARTYAKLADALGDPSAIWRAKDADLLALGIRESAVLKFGAYRAATDPSALAALLEKHHIDVVAKDDECYPALLRDIYDPPYALFLRGTLPPPNATAVSIVGSRHNTDYGLRTTQTFATALVNAGIVIVSGLAYGIDEAAHTATMRAKGMTVAVLPHGFFAGDNSRGRRLIDAILASGGAVVTEFPLHAPPLHQNFPIRNRIVAGMAQGTLVIEAGLPSGSLITAKAAIDESREVFAVPGQIDAPTSSGTNHLIQNGAHCVTSPRDILEILGVAPRKEAPSFLPPHGWGGTNANETAIFLLLSSTPMHVDDIVRRVNIPTKTVLAALSALEIEGAVRNAGGMRFARV